MEGPGLISPQEDHCIFVVDASGKGKSRQIIHSSPEYQYWDENETHGTTNNGKTNGESNGKNNGTIGCGKTSNLTSGKKNGTLSNGHGNCLNNDKNNGTISNGNTNGTIGNGKTVNGMNGLSGNKKENLKSGKGNVLVNGTENPQYRDNESSRSRSMRCKLCCMKLFHEKYHPLPENANCWRRFCHAFLCPPHGAMASILTATLCIVLLWGVIWAIIGKDALPGGNMFALVMMLICCTVAGKLVERIRLPSLLGMLLMGFLLRNVPVVNVAKDIDRDWSSALRLIALVVILIRAGLGLDFQRLRTMSWAVFRLSVMPFSTEVVVAAGLAILLFSFPWDWAFMLGFVHAAVSPAVVIPSMILLEQRQLGTNKGIPTMAIAAGSIENVLAISAFSLTLGISFSEGSLVFNILRCPMEIVLGVLYGVVFGILLWFLPEPGQGNLGISRFTLLLGGGLFSTFGSRSAKLPGAGALGCLIMAFIAAHGWRRGDNGKKQLNQVSSMVQLAWTVVFQPLLFGLIGAEVRISDLHKDVIGSATIIALVSVLVRCLVSFIAVFGAHLTHREKLFVSLSWVPKATVQAAIGSIALDTVERLGLDESELYKGRIVLTVAVYVIILTAPLGAMLISSTAPKLLTKDPEDKSQQENEVVVKNETKNAQVVENAIISTHL